MTIRITVSEEISQPTVTCGNEVVYKVTEVASDGSATSNGVSAHHAIDAADSSGLIHCSISNLVDMAGNIGSQLMNHVALSASCRVDIGKSDSDRFMSLAISTSEIDTSTSHSHIPSSHHASPTAV